MSRPHYTKDSSSSVSKEASYEYQVNEHQTSNKKPSTIDILRTGLKGSREEYRENLQTLHEQPCFRSSLMWGIGLGVVIGLHRFKETGRTLAMLDWAVGGCFVISGATWLMCRREQVINYQEMSRLYEVNGMTNKPSTPEVDDETVSEFASMLKQQREKYLLSAQQAVKAKSQQAAEANGER